MTSMAQRLSYIINMVLQQAQRFSYLCYFKIDITSRVQRFLNALENIMIKMIQRLFWEKS
jgi:hypothetical protein